MLKAYPRALDLADSSFPAELPGEFRALGQARCPKGMPF